MRSQVLNRHTAGPAGGWRGTVSEAAASFWRPACPLPASCSSRVTAVSRPCCACTTWLRGGTPWPRCSRHPLRPRAWLPPPAGMPYAPPTHCFHGSCSLLSAAVPVMLLSVIYLCCPPNLIDCCELVTLNDQVGCVSMSALRQRYSKQQNYSFGL